MAAMAGSIDRERIVMEWKPQRSGWIEERNFDIEFAETPEGYHVRVRVLGFPPLEDTKNVYPNAALAEKGALALLSSQFPARRTWKTRRRIADRGRAAACDAGNPASH